MERRRFKQTANLGQRLEDEAKRLRQQARGTSSGIERNDLIGRAKQAEAAARMNEWLSPRGLPPK